MDAMAAVLDGARPAAKHAESHDRRTLCVRLLGQSLADLAAFAKTGDDDAIVEARINLGEALKQLGQARASFAKEKETP